MADPAEHLSRPWRTGRHLGRTIYALVDSEPSDADPFLGIFDSADIAGAVVAQHNAALVPGVGCQVDAEPTLARHADHDPELPCRPALGNGLCYPVPAGQRLVPWREALGKQER